MQHSCNSLCGQEGSWECHSDCPSYHSASEILLQEEVAPVQSEINLLEQQFLQRPNMFYEECHQPVSNFVSDGFEENIILPIYDDKEGDE